MAPLWGRCTNINIMNATHSRLLQSRIRYQATEYNKQFPTRWENENYQLGATETYPSSYGKRIKPNEVDTACKMAITWAHKHSHTNALPINRLTCSHFQKSPRTGARHLRKLALAGIIVGELTEETKEYPEGVRYHRKFNGIGKDFTVLWCPHMLANLPGNKPEIKTSLSPETPLYVLPKGLMQPKWLNSSAKLITLNKEENSYKALAEANKLTEADTLKLSPQEASKEKSAGQIFQGQPGEKIYSLTEGYKLHQAGKHHLAFALMLVQAYVEKLAAAMGKVIHPREINRGIQAALLLLKPLNGKELEDFATEMSLTVEHMENWLLLDPDKNFVPLPGKWFSPGYEYNITTAYKKYYLPYQTMKAQFEEKKSEKGARKSQQLLTDQQLMRLSDYNRQAHQLKYRLIAIHPHHNKLRAARIDKWGDSLRLLVEKDRYSWQTVEKALNWLLEDPSPNARFWRKEAGGQGLKSASGLRKNFSQILNQMNNAS